MKWSKVMIIMSFSICVHLHPQGFETNSNYLQLVFLSMWPLLSLLLQHRDRSCIQNGRDFAKGNVSYNAMWLLLSSVPISFKRRKWFLILIYYSGTDAGNSSPPSSSGGSGFSPVGGSACIAGESSVTGIANNGDSSWMGYFSNVVSVSANYLPSQVTDTLMQGRAFATVHHNLYGFRNICALAM